MDESVLDRISDIELAAQNQLSRITAKKDALQKEADERIADFDKKTDERVEKRIASIRAEIEEALMQQLHRQEEAAKHTIADIEGTERVQSLHIAEAIGYRNLDRGDWSER